MNVARFKKAYQDGSPTDAKKATDNNLYAGYDATRYGSCTTSKVSISPWWYVDLEKEVNVAGVFLAAPGKVYFFLIYDGIMKSSSFI